MSPVAKNKPSLSNADIADRLASLAQLLAAKRENPFKVKAYRRAAELIRGLPESIVQLVESKTDLTKYSGIGEGISRAIAEIVESGSLKKMEKLREEVGPEMAAINEYPRLDPQRVLTAYKKLRISSVAELKKSLADGEVAEKLGVATAQHFQAAFTERAQLLLSDADELADSLISFLKKGGATRVAITGELRRRKEVIEELSFLISAKDFSAVVEKFKAHGGRADLLEHEGPRAIFRLASGLKVTLENAPITHWGLALIGATGAQAHLQALSSAGYELAPLTRRKKTWPTEVGVYRELGLPLIAPELREGEDEVTRAANDTLPELISVEDIKGDLHAHSTSSDGDKSIAEMAAGARARGYAYLGITDHSQSLKIARGVSEESLWQQIRVIDKLNAKSRGFRILKSAEVDILADGSLDYSDELLRELDYTVCSIHSRFAMNREQQTERLLRAMDNPYFTLLGHATGRKLLRRPGYEIDVARLAKHAKERGCFFEINANPNRLDLSAENARIVKAAGVKIAINTDAHSLPEFDYIRFGVDQARRAGLERGDVLNCLPWSELTSLFSARRRVLNLNGRKRREQRPTCGRWVAKYFQRCWFLWNASALLVLALTIGHEEKERLRVRAKSADWAKVGRFLRDRRFGRLECALF